MLWLLKCIEWNTQTSVNANYVKMRITFIRLLIKQIEKKK